MMGSAIGTRPSRSVPDDLPQKGAFCGRRFAKKFSGAGEDFDRIDGPMSAGSVLELPSKTSQTTTRSQSGPSDEKLAGFCATGQTSDDGSNLGIIIDWTGGYGSNHDSVPTEIIFPTEIIRPLESVHALCDLLS